MVPAAHGERLARRCPSAELWLHPGRRAHLDPQPGAAAAMGWLWERAEGAEPRVVSPNLVEERILRNSYSRTLMFGV